MRESLAAFNPRALWQNLSSSLWFTPVLVMLLGGLLSAAARRVPNNVADTLPFLQGILHNAGAGHAHELLSAILSSLITMTSLAMSLTMVVLTLAARNLGPRLIPFFMSSTLTQVTLGIFMGTIVYLLMTLRVIHEAMPDDAVPHFAVTLGSALAILCLVMLLFFIHHLAHSIVADNVVARVMTILHAQLRSYISLYGDHQSGVPTLHEGEGAPFLFSRSGYIQYIEHQNLLNILEEKGASLALGVRPGHFVLKGSPCGRIEPANLAKDEKFLRAIESCIASGDKPSDMQDVEYVLLQLVEMALRAQSPSLSDPFSAIRVIDRISEVLQRALALEHTLALFAKGDSRLSVPITPFTQLLDSAFNQLRQTSSHKPDLILRMLETLTHLAGATKGHALSSVLRQGEMLIRAAERNIHEQEDLREARERFHELTKAAGVLLPSTGLVHAQNRRAS